VTLTAELNRSVEQKVGRVAQYEPRAVRARVRICKISARPSAQQFVVRVLYEIPGEDLSAEESGPDVAATLDIVADKIERRLRKRKTAREARRRK